MQITNRLGLPQPLVDFCARDPYDRGGADRSVTELVAPARQVALLRRHGATLSEDVADRIWLILGQAVHMLLERAASANVLTEHRLETVVHGWTVSGAFDLHSLAPDHTLTNWKVTSVWAVKEGAKPEWIAAENLYAYLCWAHDIPVERLQVTALLRDWRMNERRRYDDYPATQVVTLPLPLWSPSRTADYLLERVRAHQDAERALPECTSEERWARPDVYAVMKRGRKSAVKLFPGDEAGAKQFLRDADDRRDLTITMRPGGSVRCAQYCPVASVCKQWQAEAATTGAESAA